MKGFRYKFMMAASLMVAMLLADSCAYRKLAYLQDLKVDTVYDVTEAPDVRVRKYDKIMILVSSTNPVLAAPFNLAGAVAASGGVSGLAGVDIAAMSEGAPSAGVEYTVDKNGNILFPVLGSIHVEGMTIDQVQETITGMITAKNYIKDPIVTAEFTNFQITILGEVSGKGNYILKDSRTNVLQALAMAGDVTELSQRDDIWVIRTEGGERRVYSINLKSKSCYDSPAFYLQQDDMIYVKPKKSKMTPESTLSWVTSVLSGVSSIMMILYWTGIIKQ